VDEFDFDQAQAGEITTSVIGQPQPAKSKTVPARIVARHAAAYILHHKPNLCFIHFTDTDDAGHKYGWGSPQQLQAFADIDAALAEILKAITDAGILHDTVLIVTADHGGHRKTHGSKRPDDMLIPWVVWGKGVKPGYAITDPVVTFDTAATALWLLDVPCPDSFDGRPVAAAFDWQTLHIQAATPPRTHEVSATGL